MAIVGTLPVNLANGTLADATQVMADFNFVSAQVNANAAALAGGNNFSGVQQVAGDAIVTLAAVQTLTNKTFTGSTIAGYLPLGGGTLTGPLGIGVAPVTELHVMVASGEAVRVDTSSATAGGFISFRYNASASTVGFIGSGDTIVSSGAVTDLAIRSGSGNVIVALPSGPEAFRVDSVGRFSGKGVHNNSTLPSGTTQQYIASGTYTPTLTNVSNFATITALSCQWLRVGNVVSVSGSFTAGGTASSQCVIGISLPLASTLVAVQNAAGTATKGTGTVAGYVLGDTVNARAQAVINNDGATATVQWPFHFTYVVL